MANAVMRHFEGDETTPLAQPVSTRVLSSFDKTSPSPATLLGDADFTVVVILADQALSRALAGPGASLREAITDRLPSGTGAIPTGFCLPLVIAMDKRFLDPLQTSGTKHGQIQAERAFDWPDGTDTEHGVVRTLLHTSRLILDGLGRLQSPDQPSPARRMAFLSHAKADVPEDRTKSLVHRLAARMAETNYGIDGYRDEADALPGWSWRQQFKDAIGRSALIALDSDMYPGRAACQQEVLEAKRQRRPILAVNAVTHRQANSFAYGGNIPTVREHSAEALAMDQLMLDVLTEVLRTELWLREARLVAEHANIGHATLLPRPVELADLAFHVLDSPQAGGDATLIYPDPPLEPHLLELIDALRPDSVTVLPLSEVA